LVIQYFFGQLPPPALKATGAHSINTHLQYGTIKYIAIFRQNTRQLLNLLSYHIKKAIPNSGEYLKFCGFYTVIQYAQNLLNDT
jgi:hypothetical protein